MSNRYRQEPASRRRPNAFGSTKADLERRDQLVQESLSREDRGMVLVYDEQADEIREVTRKEAAAGLMRFARSLGPGTPACGEWERKALAMARGEDWQS